MDPCMGMSRYYRVLLGFLGGRNVMFECRMCCCLNMTMHAQLCYPPPKLDTKFLALVMHSLWIPIRERKVGLP